jgi:type IV secretion system protein VirB5
MRRTLIAAPLILAALLTATPTQAMIPVIDLSAILQLLLQFQKMESQLVTAKEQLTSARDTLSDMRGSRGMEQLLGNLKRNDLPSDWNELANAITQASSAYGALANETRALMNSHSVLTSAQLATLTPAQRANLTAARQNAAGFAALSHQALAHTSARFASIQQLISAIATAHDQKAILDLQARIGAETGMLQNDAAKLDSLYRVADAQERLRAQETKEAAIADIGSMRTLPALGL